MTVVQKRGEDIILDIGAPGDKNIHEKEDLKVNKSRDSKRGIVKMNNKISNYF